MRDLSGIHTVHGALIRDRVRIALAGVGGNGSQVLNGLARLDIAMRALGHEFGLHVTAFDADSVSEANIGRNVWSPSDVGQNKAVLAVSRLNAFYGLDFDAHACRYDDQLERGEQDCDILISCVDTRAARATIRTMIEDGRGPQHYWLDLGNFQALAQVVLGEVASGRKGEQRMRLPFVTDLFPDVADTSVPEINRDSCSLAISLDSQGLFINDFASRIALQILYRLLTQGQIEHHGALVNLDSMRMSPIPISGAAWARFGYAGQREGQGDTARIAADGECRVHLQQLAA